MIIPIVIPHVRYTTAAKGAVVREVTCEKCGEEYVYLLRARVGGESRRSFEGSRAKALSALEKELNSSNRPAPCPACGWVQKNAIVRIKRLRSIAPAVVLFVLLIVPLFGLEIAALNRTPTPAWSPIVAGGAFVLCSLWLGLIWGRNYNKDPKGNLRLPLIDRYGAVRKEEFKSGASVVGPTVIEIAPDNRLRVDQDRLVILTGTCCACAGEATEGVSLSQLVRARGQVPGNSPQRVGPVPWDLPMCQACFKRTKSNQLVWTLKRVFAFILVGAIGAGYFAMTLKGAAPNSDKAAMGIAGISLFLMLAIFASVFSWAQSIHAVGPVRFKTQDKLKGTGWLRFSSPQYIRKIQEVNDTQPATVPGE